MEFGDNFFKRKSNTAKKIMFTVLFHLESKQSANLLVCILQCCPPTHTKTPTKPCTHRLSASGKQPENLTI